MYNLPFFSRFLAAEIINPSPNSMSTLPFEWKGGFMTTKSKGFGDLHCCTSSQTNSTLDVSQFFAAHYNARFEVSIAKIPSTNSKFSKKFVRKPQPAPNPAPEPFKFWGNWSLSNLDPGST